MTKVKTNMTRSKAHKNLMKHLPNETKRIKIFKRYNCLSLFGPGPGVDHYSLSRLFRFSIFRKR